MPLQVEMKHPDAGVSIKVPVSALKEMEAKGYKQVNQKTAARRSSSLSGNKSESEVDENA